MTPKHSPTPDEELEMRVTALLLGELSSDEAAVVQARIAAEPDLAALHTRLSKALELLREATAQPDEPAAVAPVQLSAERRERLLAHFKTTPSQFVSKPIPITSGKQKRDWSWAVPLSIAAILVVFGGVTELGLNALVQRKAALPPVGYKKLRNLAVYEGEGRAAPSVKISLPAPPSTEFNPAQIPSRNKARLADSGKIASNSTTIVLPNSNFDYWVATFNPSGAVPKVPPPPPSAAVPAFSSQSASADARRIAGNATTIVLPNLNVDPTPPTPPTSFWDATTPTPGSGGGLALCQLLQNEFQRDPNHPTTTSLAPVLTDLLNGHGSTSSGSESNQSSANFTSSQLYGLVPRYSTSDITNQPGSTYGGTVRQIVTNSTTGDPSLTGGNWAFSGSNTYTGATTINGGVTINGGTTLEVGGTSGQITGNGAIAKVGTGTLSLVGSASSNAPTPNIYLGGSSVLRPMPETSDVPTSAYATSVPGEVGKDVNGLNIAETAKQISTMHIAKARDAALKGDNQTLEDELTAATKIWPRNPALAEISKQIFSQGDVQQKAVTGNTRTTDKAIPPELAIQNPTSTPGFIFADPSQTLNLDSGGLMPSGAQAGAGGAGRQSYQDDAITLSSRQGSGTLTINGGVSNTFGGTISGQLSLTAGNTFTGTALTSITQDPDKYGFANEEEWRTSNLPAKPSVHAAVDAASGKPTASPQDWAGKRSEGFFDKGVASTANALTAPAINAAGEPVRSKEEKEEVVETVVPPQVAPIELPLMPKDGPMPTADRRTFTRRELDSTDSPDPNRDGAKLASDANATDRLKPAAPTVTQETENPAQTATKSLRPHRTFVVDDAEPAAAKPAPPKAMPAPSEENSAEKKIAELAKDAPSAVPPASAAPMAPPKAMPVQRGPAQPKVPASQNVFYGGGTVGTSPSEKAADDYGVAQYNHTRAKQVADTDVAWAMPVSKFNIESTPASSDASTADTAEIRHKLETIIIPKIDFHEVTVREALDLLKKKSVELDASSPAGRKGANIVLKLPDAASGKAKSKDASNPADARITVSLTNIPMIEALKYVTGLANLKFKVEPYAVSVVPLSEPTEAFVTKAWKVPPGLIPIVSEKGANAKDAEAKAREAAKNWLIANGVQFNGTASATYNAKSGRLIVRDTQDQLDLVDQIVEAESAATAKPKPQTPAKPQAPPALIPQPEIPTQDNAFSTFSLNVSDVSFKLAAASLEQGHLPDPSTVRSEEFINAFDYRDPEPAPGAPLAFIAERAHDPFAQNRDLLRFSVKTAAAGRQPGRPLNIVLLLDKSGSMERADRVNIVREALRVLTAQLQPADTLSIVTFARTPHLWADGVAGDKAADLIAKVSEITPEGGTNLEAALDLGYETAQRHFAVTSINRVVLFTDGAANLGDVNPEALTKKVEAKRKQGVALDCFGIGWEGYNDDLLEQLTRNGDGRYGFINTPDEAKENFAAQLAGALRVAASDVKVQVEFNPRRVTAYRQIGYAKHQLTKEQFRDNSVAAAQIGAAESGNALYVVAVDPKGDGDLATVRVRYRVPGTSDYREHEWVVSFQGNTPALEQASPALRLAGTAAAFSEMLAANPYAGDVTSDRLLTLLDGVPAIYGADPRPQKLEWMIRQARSLSGR